jgi:hypothetical protein
VGRIRPPLPVKLVVPMLSADPALLAEAAETLSGTYGPVDYVSPALPFSFTDYYADELGPGILRQFIAMADLIDPGRLAAIKRHTNDLEGRWAVPGEGGAPPRRRVNLDPGYLAAGKFVLATTKDQAHRVYLGEGIYAEVTLAYRAGDWRPWPWTYPDYRTEAYHAILRDIRRLYMAQGVTRR